MPALAYTTINSPIGPLLLAGDSGALQLLYFMHGRHPKSPEQGWTEDRKAFAEVIRQLSAYFAGQLKQFDVPLKMVGTAFQQLVWNHLREIPYGQTTSYGELARRIGRPEAVRAVGAANGANPIPIIVPCHRVIGSNGSLTGFGGGLPLKRKLLALESEQKSLF